MWTSFWRKKTNHSDPLCPLLGCKCLARGCVWWQKFRGKDPQSEELLDKWGCAVLWHSTLLVENSQLLNQAVASIQSARNETVVGLEGVVEALQNTRSRRR
jgi:hypothetical protein